MTHYRMREALWVYNGKRGEENMKQERETKRKHNSDTRWGSERLETWLCSVTRCLISCDRRVGSIMRSTVVSLGCKSQLIGCRSAMWISGRPVAAALWQVMSSWGLLSVAETTRGFLVNSLCWCRDPNPAGGGRLDVCRSQFRCVKGAKLPLSEGPLVGMTSLLALRFSLCSLHARCVIYFHVS
jgi:hypothetical protein